MRATIDTQHEEIHMLSGESCEPMNNVNAGVYWARESRQRVTYIEREPIERLTYINTWAYWTRDLHKYVSLLNTWLTKYVSLLNTRLT